LTPVFIDVMQAISGVFPMNLACAPQRRQEGCPVVAAFRRHRAVSSLAPQVQLFGMAAC
jgi:hypothetical protein